MIWSTAHTVMRYVLGIPPQMPDHCSAVRSMQVIRHGFMRPCQHRPGQKRPSEVSRMLWARSGEFAVWDVGIVNMRSPVLDNWSRSGSRGNEKVAKAFDFSCCRLATPHRPQQHCSSPSATGVIQQINIVLLKRFRRHISGFVERVHTAEPSAIDAKSTDSHSRQVPQTMCTEIQSCQLSAMRATTASCIDGPC